VSLALAGRVATPVVHLTSMLRGTTTTILVMAGSLIVAGCGETSRDTASTGRGRTTSTGGGAGEVVAASGGGSGGTDSTGGSGGLGGSGLAGAGGGAPGYAGQGGEGVGGEAGYAGEGGSAGVDGEGGANSAMCHALDPDMCGECEEEGLSCVYRDDEVRPSFERTYLCNNGFWAYSFITRPASPCPFDAPDEGTSCGEEGRECEYGDGVASAVLGQCYNDGCRYFMSCSGGLWELGDVLCVGGG